MEQRFVLQSGDCNIIKSGTSNHHRRFHRDIFTTLVDLQWLWTLLLLAIALLVSWLGFALIWWLISFFHDDLKNDYLPFNQTESNRTPCVFNIHDFTSSFLFSIETQLTIGYGTRTTTEECPLAIFIMCLQCIAGMILQTFMVGIVFAKITRPKLRAHTVVFSKEAVICERGEHLCLMFRVGDMRKPHIIDAKIRVLLIQDKVTEEGEVLNNFQTELNVHADGFDGNLFFIWPITIVHRIDNESPFYHMSASEIRTEQFEIVVNLEGTIESTGQNTQARSSYLPKEIQWGYKFETLVNYNDARQNFEINYSMFNNALPAGTKPCSAAELAEIYRQQERLGR